MQLSDEEVGRFVTVIINTYNLNTLTFALRTRLSKRLDEIAAVQGAPFPMIVVQVIEVARQQGWDRSLVEVVVSERATILAVKDFYDRYRAARPAAPADPYEAHQLRAGRPFINRKALRQKLRNLSSVGGARVLAIDGPRGSGKSYSTQLILFLAESQGGYQVIHIDLERELRPGAYDVVYTILSKMGGNVSEIPARGVESDPRWVLRLADTVQREARRLGGTRWLVFDGFARAELVKETGDLILELARRAEVDFRELRVVLIDYTDALPVEIHEYAQRETIVPLGLADFVQCAQRLLGDRGINDLDPADLTESVNRIFAEVQDSGPQRLRLLVTGFRQLIEALSPANSSVV